VHVIGGREVPKFESQIIHFQAIAIDVPGPQCDLSGVYSQLKMVTLPSGQWRIMLGSNSLPGSVFCNHNTPAISAIRYAATTDL
jgi:hypothetical protein